MLTVIAEAMRVSFYAQTLFILFAPDPVVFPENLEKCSEQNLWNNAAREKVGEKESTGNNSV